MLICCVLKQSTSVAWQRRHIVVPAAGECYMLRLSFRMLHIYREGRIDFMEFHHHT